MTRAGPSAPRRRQALRARLRADGLDALLVTDLLNVRYLTGFTGSNAALLVHAGDDAATAEDRTVLATDGRYVLQARTQTPDLAHLIDRACAPALLAAGFVAGDGAVSTPTEGRGGTAARIGFDSASITVDGLDALTAVAPDGALVRAPGLVEGLRSVKDSGEVEALRLACAAADAALAGMLADGSLTPGRTEREVARELEDRMVGHGAAGPAFDTIVAAGAHAAVPHHRPTDAPLVAGDLLTMDFGALVDGYHSDMTRTVVLGSAAGWQRDLYAVVALAAAAGRDALRDGVGAADVDAAARGIVDDSGHGDEFVHGLGHGVGLAVHEAPALAATATGTLAAGMAVTVEPGVYVEGRGGVRIEDTLLVGPDGAEPLTTTTRDLLVLD